MYVTSWWDRCDVLIYYFLLAGSTEFLTGKMEQLISLFLPKILKLSISLNTTQYVYIPTTFPDSSDLNIFSTYVPTCMSFPLPVVPRSSTPAISLANLTVLIMKCSRSRTCSMVTEIDDCWLVQDIITIYLPKGRFPLSPYFHVHTHVHVNYKWVNKKEAKYGKSCVNIKVEPRSTFTPFTHCLFYLRTEI